jgi:N-methylhydantoinase A
VGPESAGAVPGPVCYGKGGIHPTITDALLTLGFLNPDNFLGGKVQVFPKLASDAIRDDVGNNLNLDIQESAVRMIQILVAKTVGAVREITLERGLDPKEFLLVAFGGAGPVLAPLVGLEMGMDGVVIPALPGAFSALGMLMTDLEFDYSSTVLEVLVESSLVNLESVVEGLHEQAKAMFHSQGIFEGEYEVKVRYDLRYEGQEHSISVPVEHGDTAEALEERFGSMHYERFGHRMKEQCEVSSVRLKVISKVEKPEFMRVEKDSSTPTPGSKRRAYDFSESMIRDFDIYLRDDLRYGAVIPGPAVIEESASATVFFSDQVAIVDELGQIIIRNKKDKA